MGVPLAYRPQHVIRSVELPATADAVWAVVGGFFTLHCWHPDIERTEVVADQTETHAIRRRLFFSGQDPTIEELVALDEVERVSRYRWYAGPWGEIVKNYRACLRVCPADLDRSCLVTWESWFEHPEDAISDFYLRGFAALRRMFPG
jgi:hypothetical protein